MEDEVYRMDCWFEGHVQGVGFRYQTTRVAQGFEVSGTVHNLPDGRVHLRAEGEKGEVEAFRKAVAEELGDYIRDTAVEADTGPRTTRSFRIVS